jgi:hypothetical protein
LLTHPSFRGAREREPGIQMHILILFLDSGSALTRRPDDG